MISLARSLSFNGLANAFHVAAINGGRHVAPCLPVTPCLRGRKFWRGPTSPAATMSARCGCERSRPRTGRATTSHYKNGGDYDAAVILDLDYWVLLPR